VPIIVTGFPKQKSKPNIGLKFTTVAELINNTERIITNALELASAETIIFYLDDVTPETR
jgi:hypothetical protein